MTSVRLQLLLNAFVAIAVAFAPQLALPAEGELIGYGNVRFCMTIEEVLTALSPSATIGTDENGSRIVWDTAELQQMYFRASYHFDEGGLSTIKLDANERWLHGCHDLAVDAFEELERRYGESDSGLIDSRGKPVEETEWDQITTSKGDFTFADGARIKLFHFQMSDGTRHRCYTTVEFSRVFRDSSVLDWDWFRLLPWF